MKSFAKTYWWVFLFIALYAGYVYVILPHGPADYCEEKQRYLTNEELMKGLPEDMAWIVKHETEVVIQSPEFTGIDANTTEFFQKYPHLIWVDRNASRYDSPITIYARYFFTPTEKESFNRKWKYKTVVGVSYYVWLDGCGDTMGTPPQFDLIEDDTSDAKQNPYQNSLK